MFSPELRPQSPCLGNYCKHFRHIWLLATWVLLQGAFTSARTHHTKHLSPHVTAKLSTKYDIRRIPGKPGTIRVRIPPWSNETDYLDYTQGWERYSMVFNRTWTHGQIEDNGFTRLKLRKPWKYNKGLKERMVNYLVKHMNLTLDDTAEQMKDYEMDFIKRGNQTTEPPSCEVDWNRTGYDYYLNDETTTKWPITSLHWLMNDSYKWTTSAEFADILHKIKLSRIGNLTFKPFPTMFTRMKAHERKLVDEGQFTLMESFDINDVPTQREEDVFHVPEEEKHSDIELYPYSKECFNDSLDVNKLPKENLTQYTGQFESAEEVCFKLADAFNISSESLYSEEYFLQTLYEKQPTWSTPQFLREREEERKRKKPEREKKLKEEERKYRAENPHLFQ